MSSSSSAPSQEPVLERWDEEDDQIESLKLLASRRLFTVASSHIANVPGADIHQLVENLTHLPAVGVSQRNSRGKNGKKGKTSAITSKAYNVVASRPLARVVNHLNQITVNMRYTTTPILTTSTTVATFGASTFVLSSFDDYAQYTALFDQYKIDMLEIWIEPQNSQSTISSNVGMLMSAIDLDDANTPSNFNIVEAKQSALTTNGYDGHYHKWKPTVATALYSGAFSSYGNTPSTWIDSASPNVQHFGLKLASLATAAVQNYVMNVRASVSFRQPGL